MIIVYNYFSDFICFLGFVLALTKAASVKSGDKIRITSPFHNFIANTTLTFKTKMATAEYDVFPKLKVFLKSSTGIGKEPLLVIKKTWRSV